MRRLARLAAKDVVIALSLAAAALVLVARVLVPWLAQGETYTDGERTFEVGGADAIRYAVWDEPRSLGVAGASRPALSPDGRWLAFSSGEVGLNAELYLAEIAGGAPGEARPIAALNSESDEIAPAFGDGALYFASNRSGGAGGFDLYRAAWDGSGFGPALPMDALNGEDDDVDPAPVLGTAALVFATDRSGRGDFDLWGAAPDAGGAGWDVAELAELNTRFEEREPALAAGGRALVFASDREGTRGGFDLWRSLQEHGLWLAPRPLEGLCGAESERGPALAASGFEILFAREASGVSELWSARSLELLRRPPRPASWIDLALAAALLLLALLAWLAKRWEELDVLYKALLASVLVHLLLLLWFRYLHPESGVREAPRSEPTFQIRPIPPAPEPSAVAERAGALEVERGASAGPREPERLAPESREIPLEAPEAAALARAPAEPASAPEPEPARFEPEASEPAREPRLAELAEPAPRLDSPAPEIALAPSPTPAARSVNGPETPRRTDTEIARSSAESPGAARLAEPRAALDPSAAQPLPPAHAVALRPVPRLSPAEVEGPREALARLSGEAPPMDEPDPRAFDRPPASAERLASTAPDRRSERAESAPAAAAEPAARTLALARDVDAPHTRPPDVYGGHGGAMELAPSALAEPSGGPPLADREEPASRLDAPARGLAIAPSETSAPRSSIAPSDPRRAAQDGAARTPDAPDRARLALARPPPEAPVGEGIASAAGPLARPAAELPDAGVEGPREDLARLEGDDRAETEPRPRSFAPPGARPEAGSSSPERRSVQPGAPRAPVEPSALGLPLQRDGEPAEAAASATGAPTELRPPERGASASDPRLAGPREEPPPSAPATAASALGEPRSFAVARESGAAPAEPQRSAAQASAPPSHAEPLFEPLPIESRGESRGDLERQPSEAGIAIRAFPPPPRSQPPRAPALEGPSRAGPAAVASAAPDFLGAPESFAPSRASRDRAPEGTPRRWSGAEGSTSPAQAPAPEFQALAAAASDEPRREPVPAPQLEDTPYRSRFGAEKEVALLEHGGSPETERAVALGLAYLASVQHERGYWGSRADADAKYRQVLVGKSGLCLLAFLGAGHTPVSATRYSGETRHAVEFLLSAQDASTGHFGDSEAYSHGIATYALAECYAMTRMAELRAPLELAVAEVLRNQVRRGDPRKIGGWSYYYPDGATFDGWPRVSITAWQVMALESARLGGLAVPGEAFQAARGFLLGSWDLRLGAFRYSHDPDRLRSGFPTLPGSTPAALFALALLGEDVNEDRFARAREFVLERAPREYDYGSSEDFVFRARGNTYFWYYGSLAMFVCGGEVWERWNAAMKEALVPSQQVDGSWIPLDAYSEYAGDDPADRSYTTAACVLSLEVYYRYFTPLLQVR